MDFSILGNLIDLAGFTNTPNTALNGSYRTQDTKAFLKYGTVGFFGLGLYHLLTRVKSRQNFSTDDLIDKVESIGHDPYILKALISLQIYRHHDSHTFKMAIRNIDSLLFLENVLKQDTIPEKYDKTVAFSHFKVGMSRLTEFTYVILENKGTAHFCVAKELIKTIYKRLQVHYENIVILCNVYNPARTLKQAENDLTKMVLNKGKVHNWSKYK
jgi:hypothetical protein